MRVKRRFGVEFGPGASLYEVFQTSIFHREFFYENQNLGSFLADRIGEIITPWVSIFAIVEWRSLF